MKIPPVGAEMLCKDEDTRRTDGQTDMKKLIVAFRNFADAPKNRPWCIGVYNRDREWLKGAESVNKILFDISL